MMMRCRRASHAFSSEVMISRCAVCWPWPLGVKERTGTSFADAFRQAGVYAGKIIGGAKVTDLPVVQTTKFEFVINLRTAKALGIEIPPMLSARADDIIE